MTEQQQIFIEKLRENLGVFETTINETGTDRATVNAWLQERGEFSNQVLKINQIKREFVEAQLLKHAKDGNLAAIQELKKDLQLNPGKKWHEI